MTDEVWEHFSSSVHLTHLLQGSGQRTSDTRSETIPSSRITPDLQIHSFSSSVHLTHLLHASGQRTPEPRSETVPSSRITPDLQIHSFSSSVHLTHLLQGSDQRTPEPRSETIPSSRITPDLQIHSFSSSVHLTHLLHASGQRTPEPRSETVPSSRITPDLQIHSFSSSVHLTHLLHASGQRTPEPRSETVPSSRITPDLQIHSFFSSVHSSSTGFRSENTWTEIRDRSFIQNHSRSSDSQLLLFSSLTHLLQGSGQRTPDKRSETIPSSRITPDLQIHSFFSSVHLTRLLQGSGQRTPDTRSETIPSSRITPDLQIHSFFSSVHLTHLLQGSGQRTPDKRSETIPSSRITPDLQIHSFSSSVHSLIFYRVQIREHLTRDQRPFLHPESLQIFRFTASSLQFTHSSSTGFRSENTWHEIRDHSFIQNHSRSFRFTASSLQFTSLIFYRVQVIEHLTRDQRPFLHPESLQILQIHSFFSSVHLTHLLHASGQRTPEPRSETVPSSRITPDPSDSQLLLFSSPHSSSTCFRSENTWTEIRDHSFIQNHSRSSDSQLLLFSSLTHLLQGSGHRTPDKRSETIPSSRITPDLQIHSFFSSVHSLIFYGVQVREHLTRDQRPFLHPESLQILQIHSFFSSGCLTHLLQGSGQRTPDPRSETVPSSRITPDPSDSQLLLFSSPHSSSTGFRSENTWHEIRDHSFIQNHSRSSDSQILLFSSPHSSSTGFRSENTWPEIRDHSFIQNLSRSSDSQLLLFSSLTYLLQGPGHRTPDKRSETIPSYRITPDLQIHSFFSSVHLTHLLQGSGQRTPDTRSETIPSSRITPDLQIHSFFSSVHLTHLLQGSGQRTGIVIAEAWFCAQWPILCCFWGLCLDYCPVRRSKHGPL